MPLSAIWSARIRQPRRSVILPDGCRDLICVERPGRAPHWFVSQFQVRAISATLAGNSCMTGFRLLPGARFAVDLPRLLAGRPPDPAEITAVLAENTRVDARLEEALGCLSECDSVVRAAGALGVSMRSLQRLVTGQTGYSPVFWRQLARVRQAGRLLGQSGLADIALATGFADQAHMSRAFQRFFGTSPATFHAHPGLTAQVFSRAYG